MVKKEIDPSTQSGIKYFLISSFLEIDCKKKLAIKSHDVSASLRSFSSEFNFSKLA